jgi:predicted NACHT family NTPase
MSAPVEIFCCYAREDQQMLEGLKRHLMPLQRSGQIQIWSDTNLNAAVEWEKELHEHLESADIILLLISSDFIASEYCYSTEMMRAIERHDQGTAHVIPILLRSIFWRNAPFAKFQILPTNAKPVTKWSDRNEAFNDITEHVKRVVSELQTQRALVEADNHAHAGRHQEALICYQHALTLDLQNGEALFGRAKTLYQLGQIDASIEAFTLAEQTAPAAGDISSLLFKADALKQRERYTESLAAYDQALNLDPSNASIHIQRATILIKQQAYQQALSALEQARRLNATQLEELLLIPTFDPTKLTLHRTLAGHTKDVNTIAISPDGKILASGSDDNTIKLWELPSGRELHILIGHTDPVWSVAFSPDGKTLASGSADNTIKLWELPSGRKVHTLTGHTYHVWSVAFSPDGKTLASGSSDSTIKLWELPSGRELHTLTSHMNFVLTVAFSPDGKTLASGSSDNTIKLWELPSGRELRSLTGHTSYVRHVAFSPDGRILASSSHDNTIKLWDLSSGRELRSLTGHTSYVLSVTFSPDGNILASSSGDETIKLWDLSSGQELRTLTGHTNPVWSVVFSPDGKILASSSEDKTIRLWMMQKDPDIDSTVQASDFRPSLTHDDVR